MKALTKIKIAVLILITAGLCTLRCKKEAAVNEGQTTNTSDQRVSPIATYGSLTVNLANSSLTAYREINIEVIGLAVHYVNRDPRVFVNLPLHKGIYDLVQIKGNPITLATDNFIPTGKIDEVRLLLGLNNTLITSDKFGRHLFHLTIPDEHNIVNVTANVDIQQNQNTVVILDFKAKPSVLAREGDYYLIPDVNIHKFIP